MESEPLAKRVGCSMRASRSAISGVGLARWACHFSMSSSVELMPPSPPSTMPQCARSQAPSGPLA